MNKTVNINLGGMFFHIDEDAFQKLNRYFEAVKRSLSNSTGKEEIMKDIEMRIAELLTEKNKGEKQVVGLRDVEEIITVMGQPEDYRIDDENNTEPNYAYTSSSSRKTKKLYRDKDNGMIGGVLAGFGHYLGIDALWLRIIMVILLFGFGTGFLLYIILWILMPPAITTTEKLEMTGEPVTISNIEKKVREEFEAISEKFRNVDYDKFGNQAKTGAEKFGNALSEVFLRIFSIIGKVIGAFLVILAATTIVSLILGIITTGSISMLDFPWQSYVDNYINVPIWVLGLLVLGAIGIPFFFLLILGLKLLISNMKSIGNPAKYTLLAVWILSVGALIAIGLKQATEAAFENKVMIKENIILNENDTIFIKFKYDDFYSKSVYDHKNFYLTQSAAGKDIIYSNSVELSLHNTDEKTPYIQIEKIAEGRSLGEAKTRAEKIEYTYKTEGNQIILDNYLISDVANKYRDQKVKIFLYLPMGTLISADENVSHFARNYNTNLYLQGGYNSISGKNFLYRVHRNELKCLNCPEEFEETGYTEDRTSLIHNDSTETTVTINRRGIQIKDNSNSKKERLKISKDGVIIKTN